MKILITGGAGYNVSTMAHNFIDKKHNVTIIDNLVNGSKINIPTNFQRTIKKVK
tara:strand:- start:458 stop:619 length:162 start_codon:yes stop_codon:yes gene_type:complete